MVVRLAQFLQRLDKICKRSFNKTAVPLLLGLHSAHCIFQIKMRRALHYVLKVGDRKASYDFFIKTLGMKVLRHEEFEEGCKATCNGPYDGRWSKTMVGFGPEDSHFVLELTYNYGIGSYRLGNDLQGILIHSSDVLTRVKCSSFPSKEVNGETVVADPDGHLFHVLSDNSSHSTKSIDPIRKVQIAVKNLETSVKYWRDLCEMNLMTVDSNHCLLSYSDSQCVLELSQLPTGRLLDRGTGFGRIAFSCPKSELPLIEKRILDAEKTVLTPYVSLDTPGKATVEVVILADPNEHEICFVGDEGFRALSQVDPNADKLLQKAIEEDDSVEWFEGKGGKPAG